MRVILDHRISRAPRAWLVPLLLLLSACGGGGGGGGGSDSGSGQGNGGGGGAVVFTPRYRILASNDLGMHCIDKDFSVFSILPPYNVVNAQVVSIDGSGHPSLKSDTQVALAYAAVADAAGSINSRSVGKSNFWQNVEKIYGARLPPGEGLKGLYMPGDATRPDQTALRWSAVQSMFKAEGIPITPIDDAGRVNRYPLMRLQATDKASGSSLATLDIVLPVSEETTCSDCHATGLAATRDPGITWSANADLEIQSRENVLLLHDARESTQLMNTRPVLCAGCHYSPALDLSGAGPSGGQLGKPTLSAAMHDFHASRMRAADGSPLDDRWLTQGAVPPAPGRQACYSCHPGRDTRCLRGAMTDSVTCQNCHGGMAAVGGRTPLTAGGSLDGKNDLRRRRPWTDLPRCQSCHTGDASTHVTLADASQMATDGIRTLVAFDTQDAAASPRAATASRFAENAGTLFRYSKGHGGVGCEGCHNSTHAIWPNPDAFHNDNVAATQLQGHAGTLVECSACHGSGTLPLTLGGPHGMHTVDDSRWTRGGHGDLAKRDRGQCAACHGQAFRGTALSRTAQVRTWSGLRTVPKGTPVGCYDCHNGPAGGD